MSDQNNIISYALNGIKVLDLTRVLGGPYATQILADHGAEVIKVESKIGDEVRGWGPPFINDMASYFINVNRNKKSRFCYGHYIAICICASQFYKF